MEIFAGIIFLVAAARALVQMDDEDLVLPVFESAVMIFLLIYLGVLGGWNP